MSLYELFVSCAADGTPIHENDFKNMIDFLVYRIRSYKKNTREGALCSIGEKFTAEAVNTIENKCYSLLSNLQKENEVFICSAKLIADKDITLTISRVLP